MQHHCNMFYAENAYFCTCKPTETAYGRTQGHIRPHNIPAPQGHEDEGHSSPRRLSAERALGALHHGGACIPEEQGAGNAA